MLKRKIWSDGLNDFPVYLGAFEMQRGCFDGDGGGDGGGGDATSGPSIGGGAGQVDPGLAAAAGIGPAASGFSGTTATGGARGMDPGGGGYGVDVGGGSAGAAAGAAASRGVNTSTTAQGGAGERSILDITADAEQSVNEKLGLFAPYRQMPTIGAWGTDVAIASELNPQTPDDATDYGSMVSFGGENIDPAHGYGDAGGEGEQRKKTRAGSYLSSPYQSEIAAPVQTAPTTWAQWGANRSS